MAVYRNQSLERGFSILEYLGASTRGRSVSEVARHTGLHRATAHRLLEVLGGLGYVYKNPDDHKYWVGYQLHLFGHWPRMIARISHHARPFLQALAHEIDETVHIGALDGIQAYVCDRITTPRSLRVDIPVGEYVDAHAVAIGKALLSLRDPDTVAANYRNAPLRSHTRRTITDPVALQRELAAARKRGYAVADEELKVGLRSLAVPLLNPQGRAACAISVSGPKTRLTDQRLAQLAIRLQKTAREIVDRMVAAEPAG